LSLSHGQAKSARKKKSEEKEKAMRFWTDEEIKILLDTLAEQCGEEHIRVWIVGLRHTVKDGEYARIGGASTRQLSTQDIATATDLSRQNVRRALAKLESLRLAERFLMDGTPLVHLPRDLRPRLRGRDIWIRFFVKQRESETSEDNQ